MLLGSYKKASHSLCIGDKFPPLTTFKLWYIFTRMPILTVLLLMLLTFVGCGKENKETIKAFKDPKEVSTIFSKNVSTLISDSGITRYRVVADEWYMYENSVRPRWFFPKGIYVETFDESFNVTAFIEGDTAIFYKDKQLWELKGDVRMANTKDERFFTEQLFWDQVAQTLYSDSAIHIERGDRIIEGKGFLSNESMTSYKILQTTGIFPMEAHVASDSVKVDDKRARRENNALKYAPQDRK
ncbi:MAG: LPS export ABC transporter periplasmic protein LptC [Bacteroidales bacterium]